MTRSRRALLERQLAEFLQEPTITVARVIIGEVDALAGRVDRIEKELVKLRKVNPTGGGTK